MMKSTLTSLALLALAGSFAQAQSTVRLSARSDSKLLLQGGSNLHGWECKSAAIDATIDADPSFRTTADFAKALAKAEIRIPVTSLKCEHGGMDKNMYKALKVEKAPTISYTVASFQSTPGAANAYTVDAVGKLQIAGEERTVRIEMTAERLADGTVKAQGSVPILMTDYGIQPPTAMFGTLKTDNKVVVKFELYVNASQAVASR